MQKALWIIMFSKIVVFAGVIKQSLTSRCFTQSVAGRRTSEVIYFAE